MLLKSGFQLIRIKMEGRRIQGHVNRLCAGENGIRSIVFIKRRKNNYLVAGVCDGHHSCHHGFGAAAGYYDFSVGVNGSAHETGLFFCQRFPEILGAQVMEYWW